MSSGSVSLGNQRLYQYTGVTFSSGDSITGNGSWNVNNQSIGINLPGLYIINITTSPYASGGSNWGGLCSIYKIGNTIYCKPLRHFYGQNIMFFDSNNKRNGIFINSINRVISTTGTFLIGMDTYYRGQLGESASINVFRMSS